MMPEYDILLGRNEDGSYITLGGTDHVGLYARTGSGKDTGFVIPNCLRYPGSMVILDVKGEAWRYTSGYRKSVLNQDVYLLDPGSMKGISHRWNPYGGIDRSPQESYDQVSKLSYLLFPENGGQGASNADKFWEPAGRAALNAVATLIAQTPSEAMTLDNMLHVFSRPDATEWMDKLVQDRRTSANPYTRQVTDGISDYLSGEPGQTEGIRKTVSTRLSPWANPKIAAATAYSDFDLANIRRKPTTIYIAVSPRDIPRMRPFLRLFFDQLISQNTDLTPQDDPTLIVPVLLMMNEFIRLGIMSDLVESAQYVRGYGLRFAFVVQSKTQLQAKYGIDASEDIFSNLGAEIVFNTADRKVCEDLEKRLGDNTVSVTTHNRPRYMAWANPSKQSEAEHVHRQPLMLAQDIMRMPRTKQIIIRPGMLPMFTDRIEWFSDPNFKDLVRPPPPVPKLVSRVVYDDGTGPLVKPRAKIEVKIDRPKPKTKTKQMEPA